MEPVQQAALDAEREAVEFFREILRIPSFSGREANVVRAIARRFESLGYDEVRIDGFGNVMGRIGDGPRVIAFDAHVDTVEAGDLRLWKVDPFGAEVHGGIVYGRGASDQKGGMAAIAYAGALMKRLGLLDRWTVWMVGSVLEEDCDGLCWHYILSSGGLAPELVVLTEPTNLSVYRGHRGRMEIEVTTRGVSCHGSAPERGVNAIYRMASVVRGIEGLSTGFRREDPFLGKGSVTVSEIRSTAPSLCAVADSCTVHLDRRLTHGETDREAIGQIEEILAAEGLADAEIVVPEFERPSHTGLLFPMRQYFPTWTIPEESPYLQKALRARENLLGREEARREGAGRWIFSTNGVATMGLHGVPTLGFGPANEIHAHAPDDQCPVDHIGKAISFYLELVRLLEAEG
jgi:putative selenium metabolism hydrolase